MSVAVGDKTIDVARDSLTLGVRPVYWAGTFETNV